MLQMTDVLTVDATVVSDASVTESVAIAEQLCRRIQPLWDNHNREGLRVRFETGEILNEQLGDPNARQKRGPGIVSRVAKTLRIAESDISRMRRFAFQFQSFEMFRQAHPACTTWCEVRYLLPGLRRPDSTKSAVRRKKTANRHHRLQQRIFIRHLASMKGKLARVAGDLKPDQLEEVVDAMRNLLSVLSQTGTTYDIVRRVQVSGQAA